jgi:peptide/nickel transport system substrate-binding protein
MPRLTLVLALVTVLLGAVDAGAAPEGRTEAPAGQVTWAVHTMLVPTYFDPAETTIITSFMVLYALHDGVMKPMPGKSPAPSLAESWSASPDGLVYEFVLRKGVKFHNGDPVTSEDVKFSFDRYRGIFARGLKERVAEVETPDAGRVRFRLKQPWPDFMTFYGTLAGYAFSAPYEDLKLRSK